ncbi:bifunctional DNA primase/polymerase [Streptomyces prunicolor]|uniref:bifunctional DNA primase/polymerase n=1 Tax=Streptomyces prunicolor TaxID=67348 RepID=UPI00039C51F4|nr:bifunctional DNA primase/polymerase [Streptomyces prunicolor]
MAINMIPALDNTTNIDPHPTRTPYPLARKLYQGIEWGSPIPLPHGRKFSPPTGVTGKMGTDASEELQQQLDEKYPNGEIAVRLAPQVGALDVDTYADKTGYDDLLELQRVLGALPRGPISSKRANPEHNGKRLFVIPEDKDWHDVSESIEIVHHGWRYVVAHPSVIDGLQEQWWYPNLYDSGYHIEGRVPSLAEIPILPDAWIERFCKGESQYRDNSVPPEYAAAWLESLHEGAACARVIKAIESTDFTVSGHDNMLRTQTHLLRLGQEGHMGILAALDTVESLFLDQVRDRRRDQETIVREWNRAYDSALAVEANTPVRRKCACHVSLRALTSDDKEPGILPEEFWSARPSLAHVRQAAHARRRSGEAALAGLFARFGAMVNPDVKIDTGIGDPLSLNAFAALIGPSGSGKSASKSIPKRLVPTGTFSTFGEREYVGLGSGEGMIEAYLDFVQVETGEVKKNGDPVVVTAKRQVHSNVLFYLDEGESLTTLLGRNGSTLGATIRSAWMGEKLGQMNAQKETTRTLTEGKYSMGFIVGLQYEACTRLMEDAAYGTPHRFYFSRVTDPNQPDERAAEPGVLPVNPVQVANKGSGFTVVSSITDRLDANDLARQRGQLKVNKLNTHEPAMRAKLSAFIAALDGRTLVTEEDWELSGHMWKVSCEVRDDVMSYLKDKQAAEISAKTQIYVEREMRIDEAKQEKDEEANKVLMLAKRIGRWVHDAKEGISKRDVGQKIKGPDRKLRDQAIELGENRGWFYCKEDGRTLLPGDSRPSE